MMNAYTKQMYKRTRFNFNGLKRIDRNYSQAYQDMFVLSVTDGMNNGTFLEIGAYDPFLYSNTYLLENYFNWNGVSIDIVPKVKQEFIKYARKSSFIVADATLLDYDEILSSRFENNKITYLQIDIEPSANSLKALKRIPFNKWKFSVITYEHDACTGNKESEKKESESILESYGYIPVAMNIENDGNDPFESWWLNPELVDINIINKFCADDINKPITAYDFMMRQECIS